MASRDKDGAAAPKNFPAEEMLGPRERGEPGPPTGSEGSGRPGAVVLSPREPPHAVQGVHSGLKVSLPMRAVLRYWGGAQLRCVAGP